MTYVAKQPDESVNTSKRSPLVEMLWLLGGMLALLMAAYYALGLAVDLTVDRWPTEWEELLAENISPPFEIDEDDPFLDKVEDVLDDLLFELDEEAYDYEISIAPSNEINAFALPGGHIVVTRALLTNLQSENELAMVLGHELGHYAHRDHLRGLGRGLVMMALSLALFGSDSSITSFFTGGLNIAHASFSRKQESAADLFALDLLNKTYGHIGGATDFFTRLEKSETRWDNWLASHPASGERVLAIRDAAARNGFQSGQTIPIRPCPQRKGRVYPAFC